VEKGNGTLASASNRADRLDLLQLLLAPFGQLGSIGVGCDLLRRDQSDLRGALDDIRVGGDSHEGWHLGVAIDILGAQRRGVVLFTVQDAVTEMNVRKGLRTEEELHGG
jgi:hypothetical protein